MKMFYALIAVVFLSAPAFSQPEVIESSSTQTAVEPSVKNTDSKLNAELKIGSSISDLDLQGESINFDADTESVVAWTKISGAETETTVHHIWKRNGDIVADVELAVRSSSFRTFSRKTVQNQVGNWVVEVTDAEGNVIARKDFTIGR